MISDRRPTGGDAAERDDSPEAELEEQRRRTLARIANFATRDKKKVGERFEEGKRRITKGPEKGRRSKVSGDDDDEADDLPVRIR